MDQDGLDKFIKNQVEEHETTTDADLLWQKIQAKQGDEKKKKRRFFIFWLLGGIGLLGGLAFLYTLQFSSAANENFADNLQANSNQTATELLIEKNKEDKANLIKISDEDEAATSSQNTNNVENSNIDNEVKDTSLINNKTLKSTESKLTVSKNETVNPSKTTTQINLNKSKGTPKTAPVFNESQITKTASPNIDLNNDLPASDIENTALTLTDSTTEKVIDKIVVDSNTQLKEAENSDLEEQTALAKEELSQTLEEEKVDSVLLETPTEKTASLDEQNDKEKSKWRVSNGIAFTYGKAYRSLSSHNSSSFDYLKTRENSETSLDAIRGSLDFMLQHNSGFYVKTGLQYEQITERFDAYIERDSVKTAPNQILALTYAMNGSSSTTTGNGEITTTHWLQKTKFNRYHSIDVPFLLGYNRQKSDKKMGWFVEGGASVNISFAAKGEIFDSNNELLILDENTDLFKSQTGISLLGAVGLTYQISDKFSLWASPDMRYRLSSISGAENVIDQRYFNLGLSVGVRYHWTKD